ncbi:hypothetical protein SAMN02745121_02711 [Nannocystis exedens]|uniref:Uncharacterized protein n=1 Tax=Nannocystis exedens TaxID=54 RepID=A0A1I1X422_9BACT|nr:hypothetical protein [Nannocystis exedens]PCC70823.1 hypothetical protein NAEX_03887 [Nannocystis exedens]SFE01981.1 hypothetical protein SAMN02745121_02711 [Nannocystis exedens]
MRARDLLGASLSLLAACASQDAERFATPAPLDAPAPLPPEREEAERDNVDDELGLAEYERLLADKETRLRAAGVLLAAREPALQREARGEAGYAPPPPPAPEPIGGVASEEQATAAKSKRTRKDASGGRAADTPTVAESAARGPVKKAPTTTSPAAPREEKVLYNVDAKPAAGASSPAADENAPANRCQNICDLSAATCELEGKICDLASRHPGDPRYGDLCRRADDDCRLAAEACQRCSP